MDVRQKILLEPQFQKVAEWLNNFLHFPNS